MEEQKDNVVVDELRLLESQYDMYETTKQETIARRREHPEAYAEKSLEDTLDLMNTMQEETVAAYAKAGGDVEKLRRRKPKARNDKAIISAVERANEKDRLKSYAKELSDKAKERERNKYESAKPEPKKEERKEEKYMSFDSMMANNELAKTEPPKPRRQTPADTADFETPEADATAKKANNGPKVNYDEVTLPSRGECYPFKKDKIKVSYLVAYDENLILSPGLYKNGTFLDRILENKILDDINPDDLIQGDRDAIIIWLRAGGYGPMYPIIVTDTETGKEFETQVDLSKLNFRPFTLKGDENGHFDFTLPESGDAVKFRFLTARDTKKLRKMQEAEDELIASTSARDKIRDVIDFVKKSEKFGGKEKESMTDDLNDMEALIAERYEEAEDLYFTHDLTNRLILSTVSVNGVNDRNFIANYILNMGLKDATAYRKYIIDNEPGIDYNVKVERPESLGGGSIETFLQLDQFIFVY